MKNFNNTNLLWVWNVKKNRIINKKDKESRQHCKNGINREICISDLLSSFICLLDLFYVRLLSEVSEKMESNQDSHKRVQDTC